MTCPHCGALSDFRHVWADGFTHRTDMQGMYAAAYRCSNELCALPISAIRSQHDTSLIVRHWPTQASGKAFPDVPSEIAGVADEAHKCLSIGAYRAAMALARAVLEATAKEKGFKLGTLEKKIDDLAGGGLIRTDTKDAAHAVRLVGNDAAHGDLATMIVDADDARDVLELMDDILEEVFQSRARVARVTAARAARKSGSATP